MDYHCFLAFLSGPRTMHGSDKSQQGTECHGYGMGLSMSDTLDVPEAMQILFDATIDGIRARHLDFPDVEKAWQTYLKTHYLLTYATTADGVSHQRTEDDAAWLMPWVREADSAELQQAIEASLLADGKLALLPIRGETADRKFAFRDKMELAEQMNFVVIYGEPLDVTAYERRIQDVVDLQGNLSQEQRTASEDEYQWFLQQTDVARDVLYGRCEPEVWDPEVWWQTDDGYDDDIFTEKNLVGSYAWNCWTNMLMFVRGEYYEQDRYDHERISALHDMQNCIQTDGTSCSCSPYDAVADPVGTRDRLIAEGKIHVMSPPRWYADFMRLGWNEAPGESVIRGFMENEVMA